MKHISRDNLKSFNSNKLIPWLSKKQRIKLLLEINSLINLNKMEKRIKWEILLINLWTNKIIVLNIHFNRHTAIWDNIIQLSTVIHRLFLILIKIVNLILQLKVAILMQTKIHTISKTLLLDIIREESKISNLNTSI